MIVLTKHALPKQIGLFIFLLCCCLRMQAQVSGCTDPAANNYNATAVVNDGSCTYNKASISAKLNCNLNTAA